MRLILLYLLFTNSCNTSSDDIFKITISTLLEKRILEISDSVLYINSQNSVLEIPNKILVANRSIIIKKTDKRNQIPFLNFNFTHQEDIPKLTFTVKEKGGFKYKGEILFKLKDGNYIFHDIIYVTEIE